MSKVSVPQFASDATGKRIANRNSAVQLVARVGEQDVKWIVDIASSGKEEVEGIVNLKTERDLLTWIKAVGRKSKVQGPKGDKGGSGSGDQGDQGGEQGGDGEQGGE